MEVLVNCWKFDEVVKKSLSSLFVLHLHVFFFLIERPSSILCAPKPKQKLATVQPAKASLRMAKCLDEDASRVGTSSSWVRFVMVGSYGCYGYCRNWMELGCDGCA